VTCEALLSSKTLTSLYRQIGCRNNASEIQPHLLLPGRLKTSAIKGLLVFTLFQRVFLAGLPEPGAQEFRVRSTSCLTTSETIVIISAAMCLADKAHDPAGSIGEVLRKPIGEKVFHLERQA
jgi:hypothetical protein